MGRDISIELADACAEVINAALKPIRERLDASEKRVKELETELDARVKALEDRPTLRYCGIYEAGATYRPGDFVTNDGHTWACKSITRVRPTFGSEAASAFWTLACKAGRPGKDGKDGRDAGR
jgi:hypothetical protein